MVNVTRLLEKGDSQLQWIDRLEAITSFATKAGAAVLGYQAFEKVAPGSGLSGAIVSQIALRLAESNNLASGAAGVATLSGMGILNVYDPAVEFIQDPLGWIRGFTDPILETWEYAWRRGLGTLP